MINAASGTEQPIEKAIKVRTAQEALTLKPTCLQEAIIFFTFYCSNAGTFCEKNPRELSRLNLRDCEERAFDLSSEKVVTAHEFL